jgi:hypothetical protein
MLPCVLHCNFIMTIYLIIMTPYYYYSYCLETAHTLLNEIASYKIDSRQATARS